MAFAGSQVIVTYQDLDGFYTNIYAKSFDPFTCLLCEKEQQLVQPFTDDRLADIASHYNGGDDTGSDRGEALIVFESFSGGGDVLGQVFDSPATSTDLGGGCGSGGAAFFPCPKSGNADFTPRIQGAAPNTLALMALGFSEQPFGCGACVFWPNLATSLNFVPGSTDANGDIDFNLPIPATVTGGTFSAQWAVLGGACPAFGIDLSDAVRFSVFP